MKEAEHGNQKHRRESLNKKVKKCIFETESELISLPGSRKAAVKTELKSICEKNLVSCIQMKS